MSQRQTHLAGAAPALLLVVALSTAALAGSNPDFSVSLEPQEVPNVRGGQIVDLQLRVEGATQVSGFVATFRYNARYVTPVEFIEGEIFADGTDYREIDPSWTGVEPPTVSDLTVEDILTWRGFATRLTEDGLAAEASPGKEIWDLLPQEIQLLLDEVAAGTTLLTEEKSNIINALNLLDRRQDLEGAYPNKVAHTREIRAGYTLLPGDPVSGLTSGALGTMGFRVIRQLPPTGIPKSAKRGFDRSLLESPVGALIIIPSLLSIDTAYPFYAFLPLEMRIKVGPMDANH